MMAKNPDERFQTPIEVAGALKPFIAEPSLDGHSSLRSVQTPSRSFFGPLAIIATLMLIFFAACGAVIVVATARGLMHYSGQALSSI